jgi:iron(III) transport system substrate-binding protein
MACLVLAGCPRQQDGRINVTVHNAATTTPSDPQQTLELARAEGELSWYTSTPEAEANALLAKFMTKYPFIHAQVVREGTFVISDDVMSQVREGKVVADVVHVMDPATFVELRTQGSLLYYDSPESHVFPTVYKDSGYWTAMRVVLLGLAYDTRRVTGARVPTSWESLLSPQWKGRVGLKDAATAGDGYGFYYLLRERYGTIFWQRVGAQRPNVYRTSTQMLEALNRGEVDILAGISGYSALNAIHRGQSLKMVWPAEGVPLVVGPLAILAAAPHPNCARLFVDFMLSAEGQQAMTQIVGAYSVRPGVPAPTGKAPLSSFHLLMPTAGWADYAAKHVLVQTEAAKTLRAQPRQGEG